MSDARVLFSSKVTDSLVSTDKQTTFFELTAKFEDCGYLLQLFGLGSVGSLVKIDKNVNLATSSPEFQCSLYLLNGAGQGA